MLLTMADAERGDNNKNFAPSDKENFNTRIDAREARLQRELDNIRGITAQLARVSEKALFRILRGEQIFDQTQQCQLETAFDAIIRDLKSVPVKTRGHEDLSLIYQSLTAPAPIPLEPYDSTGPTNEHLDSMFRILDDIYGGDGAKFLSTFVDLPTSQNGYAHPHIRQLTEGALILSKIALNRIDLPATGTILPDFWKRVDNVPVTQMDGVIVYSTDHEKHPENFDELYLNGRWDIFEIKTVFRAELTSGTGKLTKPRSDTIRQTKVVLSNLFRHHNGLITFPGKLHVIYLRGVLENVYHTVSLDSSFWYQWQHSLRNNYDRLNREQMLDDETEQDLLI